MKKIFFTLLAFAGMLASCSNDDIEIIQTQNTVTVNPSYVISPFTYENVTGELESFPTDYKLRVESVRHTVSFKLRRIGKLQSRLAFRHIYCRGTYGRGSDLRRFKHRA